MIKHHALSAAIATAIASSVTGGALHWAPRHIEQVAATVYASKHAWPDLTDAQKAALTGVLKTLRKGIKFDIVCDDAGCYDLAADIDDAMEAAGIDSALDHVANGAPIGYGAYVQVNATDLPAAQTAIAALAAATNGELDPPIKKGPSLPGYVTLVIGKYRR
jgi:hypothetical protein